MFFCTLCTFLSRCVRLEEGKGDRESEKRHFSRQFQTTLLRRCTSPLKSSINYQKKLTTTNAHIFFCILQQQDDDLPILVALVMGLQHAFAMVGGLIVPPYVVMRFSVSIRRHGFAAIRHRVFAHFIWYFYHFELHSV